MENTTQTNTPANDKHICAHGNDNHCCNCAGCGSSFFASHKGYFIRRWISILVGVLLAFFVGMKLGEIKGYIHGSYGMMPHADRMMKDWNNQY